VNWHRQQISVVAAAVAVLNPAAVAQAERAGQESGAGAATEISYLDTENNLGDLLDHPSLVKSCPATNAILFGSETLLLAP